LRERLKNHAAFIGKNNKKKPASEELTGELN